MIHRREDVRRDDSWEYHPVPDDSPSARAYGMLFPTMLYR